MLEIQNSEIGSDADSGGGHIRGDAHVRPAAPVPITEIVGREAGEGEVGQIRAGTHTTRADLADLIDTIREEWRQRQNWQRAEVALLLRAKGGCRRLAPMGDKAEADRIFRAALGKGEHPQAANALVMVLPLEEARQGIERHRRASERRLAILAGQLPVAPFVAATRGVGMLSLAAIVGEAGDLSAYANPAKLWKRMGAAVIGDRRQQKMPGADAMLHGYSPVRRSVLWNIGSCIVKAGGPLKAIYDDRKVAEMVKCEAIAANPIERARYARGGRYAPRLHAHNRAQRYVEKRFLRELWRAWRSE